MAGDTKRPDEWLWPGAVEAGLQVMPEISPIVGELRGANEQTWMNQIAAEREKGAPLTAAERRRILRGKPWRARWRQKQIEELAAKRARGLA